MTKEDIANYEATERLRGDRLLTIRAVRPDDKGLVIEALPGVSAESVYRRLFTTKKGITDEGLRKITEVDFVTTVALVATLGKDDTEQLVGGGRYVRGDGSQRAEVAFLIEDAFQGLGIAPRIFKHLVAIAHESGIKEFEAEVLPTNEAMLKVFTRSGIPVTRTVTRDSIHVLMDLTEEGKKRPVRG